MPARVGAQVALQRSPILRAGRDDYTLNADQIAQERPKNKPKTNKEANLHFALDMNLS